MTETSPRVKINREIILQMVNRALEGRRLQEGLFTSPIIPPEAPFIDRVKRFGEVNKQVEFPLHALFFVTSTLYADNSTRQMRLIVNAMDSGAPYAWLFTPSIVARRKPEEVIDAARNLIRPGYNQRALERWQHNSLVLVERYGGDLRNFFLEFRGDAPEILKALVGPKRKAGWELFHRFGPKLGRLFLQWVNQYELYPLENIEAIGVPVDFQIARLTIQCGGLELTAPTHKHFVLDKTLVPLYAELCQEEGLHPQQVSETLWLIGSRCCNNRDHRSCPLQDMCTSLISRKPLDRDGLFDPKDVGRWKGNLNNQLKLL